MKVFLVPLLGFLLAFLVSAAIFLTRKRHGRLTADFAVGVQKVHDNPKTPRIGGLSLYTGLFGAVLLLLYFSGFQRYYVYYLLGLGVVFFAGFLEDVTKKVSPLVRLFAAFLSTFILAFMLELSFPRTGFYVLDAFFANHSFWMLFLTIFFLSAIVNAYNVIDGYNGLMLLWALLPLVVMGYLSYHIGDRVLALWYLIHFAVLLGFFVWNFPFGFIFSGDSGAYLVGALMGASALLFLVRHPMLSPWFFANLLFYPAWELFFSTFRKIFERRKPTQPDAHHLHLMLLPWLKRFVHAPSAYHYHLLVDAILVLPILPLSMLALHAPTQTNWQIGCFFLAVLCYLILYTLLRITHRHSYRLGGGSS